MVMSRTTKRCLYLMWCGKQRFLSCALSRIFYYYIYMIYIPNKNEFKTSFKRIESFFVAFAWCTSNVFFQKRRPTSQYPPPPGATFFEYLVTTHKTFFLVSSSSSSTSISPSIDWCMLLTRHRQHIIRTMSSSFLADIEEAHKLAVSNGQLSCVYLYFNPTLTHYTGTRTPKQASRCSLHLRRRSEASAAG
jgi:hypothetical protein